MILRLKGLNPQNKSLLFKVVHELLPSKERLFRLNQSPNYLCWCNIGVEETYQHLFFNCDRNNEVGQDLVKCLKFFDSNLTESRCLRLELSADQPFLLASAAILSTGLEYIWENRKRKKSTSLFSVRAEIEAAIAIKRKSRLWRIKECGDMMDNMLNNFLN